MPHYKLYYMNMRGRAELTRLIFAAAGEEFEDFRMSMPEFKKNFKADAPFGQLPMFEVDGKRVCQSNSIARYVAKQVGLAGNSDWDHMRCDTIVDCVEDLIKPFMAAYRNPNQEQKASGLKKYEAEQLPLYLGYLEKMLTENNGGDGYFVGDSLTWADLACFVGLGYPDLGEIKYDLDSLPHLKALRQRVESHPGVAKWLEVRPKTPA